MWLTLSFLSKLKGLVPVCLRGLVGGSFFFVHGMSKIRPDGVWDWGKGFASSDMAPPDYLLYIAAWTEFLGGAALLLGLFTRWAALGICGVMCYAIFKIHWAQGYAAHVADGNPAGFEFATAFAVASLCIAFTGPGVVSLDRLFFGKRVLGV